MTDSNTSVGQRMGVAALMLSASILLSRVLGFAREVIISNQYGASVQTDAYLAAFTLPELMSYFLAGGTLSITFIPLFSSYVAKGDEEGGWKLFSTIATTFGLILVTCVVLAMIFAPSLTPLIAPGFKDPQSMDLVVSMTRIVLPAQLAFYFGGLLQATLFVKETFWTAAVAPLIYNACIITCGVALGPWIGIQGFSVGVLVGSMLGPLSVPLWAARKHIKYRFRISLRDPDVRAFLKLSLPLMLGATLVTVDDYFIRYFGSLEDKGSITWMNNSRKLMMVLFAIIGQAAGQAALPYLTRLFHEGKDDEMGQMLTTSTQRVVFLSVCASAGLMAVSSPLVFTIFQHGEFSVSSATTTAQLLIIFSFGLTAWTVQSFAVRGFYARRDTFTPMVFGTVVLGLMIPVYWGLSSTFGVYGLAIASSVGITINAIVTLVVYARRYGHIQFTPMLKSLGRALAVAAVAGGATATTAYFGQPWFDIEVVWQSGVLLSLCAVVYLVCFGGAVLLLKPQEMDVVMDRIRAKLKR